ncbi:hypothetical protein Vretifemale_11604, partial [Volvox reticuliferus]
AVTSSIRGSCLHAGGSSEAAVLAQGEPFLDDDYLDQLWRALRQRSGAATAQPPPPMGTASPTAVAWPQLTEDELRRHRDHAHLPSTLSCEDQQLMEALRSLHEEYGHPHCEGGGGDGGRGADGTATGAVSSSKKVGAAPSRLKCRSRSRGGSCGGGGAGLGLWRH